MFLCLGLSFLVVGGCGGAIWGWSSNSLKQGNNIQKIAVLVESQAEYVGISDKYVYSLESSRQLGHRYLPAIKSALQDKGYQVVYIEPAGYIFMGLRKTRSLADALAYEDLEATPLTPLPLHQDRFARLSPALQQEPGLARAVTSLYTQCFNAFAQGKRAGFYLAADDLALVRQATGADTVCLANLAVRYHTSGRKGSQALAGAASAGLLGLLSSISVDREGGGFTFIDARSGEVLWMYGDMPVEGNSSPREVVDRVLVGFPKKP